MSEQWGGPEEAVAIIGMSGRFPGAGSVEELWRNVRAGVESLSLLDDGDLAAAGVDGATASQPGYVRAAFPLEGVDRFDAGFFGLTPREAEILDPQHRLFLECAWSALEDAGYDAESWTRPISLYAGAGASAYLYANLMQRMDVLRSVGTFQAGISNEKDFLATRVAHKLGLRGPCVTVQTACSTSLVAVHMACQALLSGESDLALAGGVSVSLPQRAGYVAREGDILSPDGHCRAFDARAQGTVRGSGVGAVVLKRLSDAVAQGDTIHAVILGSAVNNDGAERVGYTAPGVEGQAAVITEALGVSRVKAGSLQYVEAHGTGTPLGDPIEVSALNQAFRSRAGAPGTIGLGSLKTNIGHLDTAAGIAGLLKVVLALRHQELPPSLHFERPNPGIDFAGGPFYVNATLRPWETDGGPRRAGVSSFGIGGTNAHVILQEAPRAPAASSARSAHLLVLSARNEQALEEATRNLAAHLTRHPGLELADVAHTLLVGRRRFSHRRVLVCRDVEDARGALASRDASRVLTHVQEATKRQVVFMFPGQGAQYAGMGRGLYEEVALFRKHVDACCEHLAAHLGMDLRPLLLAKEADTGAAERQLRRTALAQPALFTVSYALAKVWMSWGVKPQAMVGHSVGEYVAACLAGVLKLEDALALVAVRGRLMEEMPAGAMLSVSQPEQEVLPLLGSELSLAAVNAPSSCVVAGPVESVAALEARLARAGVAHRRLHTSHAFHSSMMDPILGAFGERLRAVSWAPPALPWISNVTGTWVRPEQATNPEYWVEHLRRTVRFGDGVRELLAEPSRVFLEVGPGGTLGTLVRQVSPEPPAVMASMRHPYETRPDLEVLLGAAGGLWLAGVRLDGTKLHAPEPRRRIPLPTYAFQRERYWVDARPSAEATVETPARMTKRPESKGWIYAPAWRQARREGGSRPGGRWLVFAPSEHSPVVERLRDRGSDVVEVVPSERFEQRGPRCYALDGSQPEHHARLVDALLDGGGPPERVVFLGSVPHVSALHLDAAKVDAALASGFYPSLFFARELSARVPGAEVELTFVTEGAQDVTGEEPLCPAQALALGPCRVLPQELGPAWHCRAVDTVASGDGTQGLDALVAELESEPRDAVVALRAGRRWVEDYASASLPEPSSPLPLRQGGVYLLTGGLGRMGLAIAGLLASEARAKLVLMGRTALPEREAWEAWIASHGAEDATARVLQELLELERRGAEVLAVRADVSREDDVRAALARARARFGRIHGVVHAAGVVGPGAHVLVQETDVARCEAQFQAKVRGLLVLSHALEAEPPEFMVLQSSLAAVLGGIGFSAYAAANLYMDAFAARQARQGGTRWLTVDWDGWSETQGRLALTMDEGVRTFRRILAADEGGRFVVSTGDLAARRLRVARPTKATGATPEPDARVPSHARPVLGTPYVAPRDVIEREIAGLWQELLGIERVGIHDSFFELGGHSLLGTQMVSRVKESFGVEVSIRGLFETPTVAGVAMAVLQAQAAQTDAGRLEQLLAELEGAS